MKSPRPDVLLVFGAGVVGRRQIGRAADQLGQRRRRARRARCPRPGASPAWRSWREFRRRFGDRAPRARPATRPSAGARIRRASARERASRASQAAGRSAAARADLAPGSAQHIVGHDERRRSPSRAARVAPAISSAPSGAPCAAAVPALVGAPNAMIVRQAISDWAVAQLRAPDRGGDGVGVVAVDPLGCPAMRPEALDLVVGRAKSVGPSIEIGLSSQNRISLSSLQMAGERDRLLADAFHQAAVAAEDIGVVIDELVAEARREQPLGERHADRIADALAERARRHLDAGRDGRARDGRRCGCRAGGSASARPSSCRDSRAGARAP